ncbi:MAG: ABC transporter substrate-binding protein [Gemmatimonadota bacterium]
MTSSRLTPHPSRLTACSVFSALAILAAGCARPDTSQRPGPTGGTLIIVTAGDADVLFPPSGAVTTSADVAGLVFSRLAELTGDRNTVDDAGFRPSLAQRWEHADSTTLVFHLDPRARWHDGAPVRAEDVAFTYDVYRDALVGSRFRPNLAALDSVTVRDSLTAVFHFARWYPEQLYDATYHARILPKHLLDSIPRDRLASSAFARAPVGSGPFRFVRWDANAEIEVAADTGYFLGRPRLDRVIWRVVPDLAAGVSALVAGDGDAIEVIPPRELRERVAATPHLRLVPYASNAVAYIAFNLKNRDRREPHPIFGDRDVRRAIAMAVNRAAVVRSLFGTEGEVPVGPTARAQWIWSDSIRQLPFDTAEAKRLLDASGWRDANGDGVREKAGKPLRFTLLLPTTSRSRQDAAVLIQAQLRAIGVEMRLLPLEFALFEERSVRRDFDATFQARTLDASPASILQLFGGEGAHQSNYGGYASPTFDSLARRAIETPARAAALPLWRRALETLNDDAPALFVFSPPFSAAVHRRIEGVSIRPDEWLATVTAWYVPPQARLPRDR